MKISKFLDDLFGEVDVLVETVIDENGRQVNIPWFAGNQLLEILGYDKAHYSRTLKKFVDEEDQKIVKYSASPKVGEAILWKNSSDHMDKVLISEYGMYSLVMRSRVPKAREFQYWVTHNVLPSIGKHGAYVEGQEDLLPEQQASVVEKEEALSKEVEALKKKNKELLQMKKELAAKNASLQKRRHELIADGKKYKANVKKYKTEAKKLRADNKILLDDAREQDKRYLAVLSENSRLMIQLMPPKKSPVKEEDRMTVVGPDGFVISFK